MIVWAGRAVLASVSLQRLTTSRHACRHPCTYTECCKANSHFLLALRQTHARTSDVHVLLFILQLGLHTQTCSTRALQNIMTTGKSEFPSLKFQLERLLKADF